VILPDRAQVTMTVPFMRAYVLHVIRVCHKRGAHAMGGMSAFIPIRSDPEANARAMEQVAADKQREASDGHDGTWVAHPGLVQVALDAFNKYMPGPNQIDRQRDDAPPTSAELLAPCSGSITWGGLVGNIKVGVQYIEAWLRGIGCVPLYNLMEDAATAEICRTQVWQWLFHGATMEDGRAVTHEVFDAAFEQAMDEISSEIGAERLNGGKFQRATELFRQLVTQETFEEFLTLRAYDELE
jgi:malate synthase